MRQALAAARNPSVEDGASLSIQLRFLDQFLEAHQFADDEAAVGLQTQLDAAWKGGHPEPQYARLRGAYAATTRGNLEYWRDELVKAREELLQAQSPHRQGRTRADAGMAPKASEGQSDERPFRLPEAGFWYSSAPERSAPLSIPVTDTERPSYEAALDAAVHPSRYSLGQLLAFQDFLFDASTRNFPDTDEYLRLVRSQAPASSTYQRAELLHTANGYLQARYHDLALVTSRLLLEQKGDIDSSWQPAPWRERPQP